MVVNSTLKRNFQLTATSLAVALAFGWGTAQAIEQSGEAKNMQRVGHTDLQGRPAYHPNVIDYPDGRVIAFVGTHGGQAPNPLKGGAIENNGTFIIDMTDPANPVEKFHIPSPAANGQTQSVRMCLGSQLPGGQAGKVYMMRNVQGSASSGYETWDVTNVSAPVFLQAYTGIRSSHKHWWECSTGVAYLPGSRNVPQDSGQRWRQSQSMVIVDWANPEAQPVYLRTYGLVGAQPGASGPTPPSLHGAISAHDHPNATGTLARGHDVIGNRVYAAWGVGDDGVMTALDRSKLLPPLSGGRGGTYAGPADTPAAADLESALASILYMSPDQGGHTSFPVFGLKPPSYQDFTGADENGSFLTRDIVLLASESTADRCEEAPHFSFVVDVTAENSKSAPPGTRVEQNVWQGPMVLSTMSVDPRSGEKYPRGNYCKRGARFGVHSSEENFRNPLYGKLTALAYFTGGVRIWDIREPQAPREIAFYVPQSNALTEADGYMTNNVEVDNRGYILAVDRNGAGFDILQLKGCAEQVLTRGRYCKDTGAENAAEAN
jgi:hypothetical protein